MFFAELVVRQAYEISKLKDKHLTETHTYFRNGKIAQLPVEIADKNILVASSNNGAVQKYRQKNYRKKDNCRMNF